MDKVPQKLQPLRDEFFGSLLYTASQDPNADVEGYLDATQMAEDLLENVNMSDTQIRNLLRKKWERRYGTEPLESGDHKNGFRRANLPPDEVAK